MAVHGSHYALVVLDGLLPGSDDTYAVRVDDEPVWPRPGMPPSRIRTLDPIRRAALRLRHLPHHRSARRQGNKAHGVDALRTLALALRDDPEVAWPDVLLLLGDQVYADTTPHEELKEFMAARRSLDEPPGRGDQGLRRVRRALPAGVERGGDPLGAVDRAVGDDLRRPRHPRRLEHLVVVAARDPRDHWWQERIVSGLGSYWLHQHLGNLSPAELAQEEVWCRVVEHAGVRRHRRARPDRATSTRSRPAPTPSPRRTGGATPGRSATARWSSSTRGRPASCDPTGARCSTPTRLRWVDGVLHGGVRHLFIGTSLPFLLPPGLHDFEAMDEALAQGAYGRTRRRGPPRSCGAASTSSTGRPSTRASTSCSSW